MRFDEWQKQLETKAYASGMTIVVYMTSKANLLKSWTVNWSDEPILCVVCLSCVVCVLRWMTTATFEKPASKDASPPVLEDELWMALSVPICTQYTQGQTNWSCSHHLSLSFPIECYIHMPNTVRRRSYCVRWVQMGLAVVVMAPCWQQRESRATAAVDGQRNVSSWLWWLLCQS